MASIQTLGQLQNLLPSWSPLINRTSLSFYDAYNYDYATIYRTQPNVRTCVDFLARNIAQLKQHVYQRVSDTDRKRLTKHPLARLYAQPLPPKAKVTYYRLIEALVSDLGIYFNAFWLKLRTDGQVSGLLRLPPLYMTTYGGLIPSYYELNLGGTLNTYPPEEIVHIRGYNPENPVSGLSPEETLRRVLAEEHAAGQYREGFWQHAARREGVVKRPATAPDWSDDARARWINEFHDATSGNDNTGKVIVLEEGMEWQDTSFNAQESEYLAGRKLTREECARAYHIPLPMVGILDHATFSNITEQHKNLYQDSLGPWLAMIEQDVELQLLTEFEDSEDVYVEFNLLEKLQGSFEDQVKSLQAAVGRPWMTANEARARMNMPRLEGDADELVTPLNVITGGMASPQDTGPKSADGKLLARKQFDSHAPELRERHQQKWVEVLTRHYRRQEQVIVSRVPAAISGAALGAGDGKSDIGQGVWWDDERWNSELSADLLRLNHATAQAWAERMLQQTGAEINDLAAFEERMLPWLKEHSTIQAANINAQTRDALAGALTQPEALQAVKDIFLTATTTWALLQAISALTTASNFGAHEAANAAGLRKKTWRVNSKNPRPGHSAINGETVGIRDKFSNGMRWPGDPAGGAENNANCVCTVVFG